jgi:Uma2 family endonuclease
MQVTAQDALDPDTRHKLTVQEYLLLDREGAFGDRRTELFDGEIYYMSPKHRRHARVLTQVVVALSRALEGSAIGLCVLTDISVHLSDHDVPEPDVVVTDAPDGDGILPLAAVKIAIEVSDTTLAKDLGLKADLYARAGVPEYWVVDVNENRVLMHAGIRSEAEGKGYDGQLEVPFGEVLHAATVKGLIVPSEGWG